MRIAVVQHQIRTHERVDLAAMLALAERAVDQGADTIVFPCVPGLGGGGELMPAFIQNVCERAPQLSVIASCAGRLRLTPLEALPTRLGRTLVLAGDECIDPELFPVIAGANVEALVWQIDTESPLQAEAILELALDASLSLSGLVLVSCFDGEARGARSFGGSAIVHLGELLAEAGQGEDLLLADVAAPVSLPIRRGPLAEPGPVLEQRLAVHRGAKITLGYPATID